MPIIEKVFYSPSKIAGFTSPEFPRSRESGMHASDSAVEACFIPATDWAGALHRVRDVEIEKT